MNTMLAIFSAVLLAVLGLLLLPTLVLAFQVFSARRAVAVGEPPHGPRPRITVLMPAHDEAAGISVAIESVLCQLRPGDALLVVADNCTDETARIATSAGAQVVERHDAQHRGKGYALDFGVRHLHANPPELLVIVDADCTLAPGCLAWLAQACALSGRPVQALYLMKSPPGAGLKTRLAELAWLVKNQVRPLGFGRWAMPCQLMGTGMAFPWPLIKDAPLATGHIVEDMQLGLDLAMQGTPPLFCPKALVTSTFPADTAGLATQRTRWEHGHLGVIAGQGPRLLARAIKRRQPHLLAMALDLCVPPLAALALLLVLAIVPSLALWWAGGYAWPLAVAVLALGLFSLSILWAWHGFGRRVVSLRELLSVPTYVLSKLPIYGRLLTRRQAEWVRTKRDDGTR